jgi:hypothetical protein
MIRTLQRWMNAQLESQEANRHQLAAVTRAMTRFPDPQFVPGLRQMLERDLADWARAREERAKAPHRGPTSPDVTHDHTLGYRSAFVAIGNEAAVAVLKEYLPDPRFGVQAAGALLEIWNRDHPSGKAPIAAFGQDYSRAKQLDKQRREAPETLAASDYAEAIFDVIRSIGTSAADSRIQLHAIALAVLGMPHGSKRTEIDSLLALPVPFAAKQRLLIASAMAGEVLRSDILVAGIDELLEAGKTESWRLAENRGELMNWVELFAFSDDPEAVLGVLDRLPEQYGYPSSLDRLLSALAKSPHEGASISFRRLRAAIPGSWRGMIGLRPSLKSARQNPVKPFSGWFAMGSWVTQAAPTPFTCRDSLRTSARNSHRSRKRCYNAISA